MRRPRYRSAHARAQFHRDRTLRIEPLEERRMLAVVTVTTNQDLVDLADGVVSLREAIFVANTVAGTDTIEFAPALTSGGPTTILLTQGELVITDSLTLHGPGAGLLTIDASGNDPTPTSTWNDGISSNDGDGSRVFNIDNHLATLLNVEIVGLRITGGDTNDAGGGIYTTENLTVRQSIVAGNASGSDNVIGGGGIYSAPFPFSISAANSLTVLDSMILDNAAYRSEGGGIRKSTGSLTVERSVILGNVAGRAGAGISAADVNIQVLIHDSLIRKNSVRNIAGSAGGGGIFLFDAVAKISNTSIVENDAKNGGAIYVQRFNSMPNVATTTLVNSTLSANIARNGIGGIFFFQNDIVVKVSHSTIANNTLGAFNFPVVIESTINAGNSASDSFQISGDNLRSPTSNGILAPLVSSGEPLFLDGSRMPMHALLPGSPAIDAGNPAQVAGVGNVPEFDQRGMPFSRVLNGDAVGGPRIDIGAYERHADEELSFVVDTFDDDDGDDYSSGDRSLREVIRLANVHPGVDTITFSPALTAAGAGAILLKFGEMVITEPLVIDGPGAELITVDAQHLSRIFNVTATSGDFTIAGLTLAHGRTTGNNVPGPIQFVNSGGAIRSVTLGKLTLDGAHIVDSGTTGTAAAGGGVFTVGQLVLNGSVVRGNSTAGQDASGGGIASRANIDLVDSTVSGNRVNGSGPDVAGGGVWTNQNVSVTRSTICNNGTTLGIESPTQVAGGGGVFSLEGNVTVTDSVIRGNFTTGFSRDGGGIRTANGNVTITRSLVADNRAGGSGGGVSAGQLANVMGSTISGNTAVFAGGGINAMTVALLSSTVSGNSTNGTPISTYSRGGGIASNLVTSLFSTITDNHALGSLAKGGGIAGLLRGRGSIVAGNSAELLGDDVFGGSDVFFTLLGNLEGAPQGSLTEAPVGSPDVKGNLIGGPVHGAIDAKLGPLAYYGGFVFADGSQMLTHAVLVGSPALDAGDPAAVAGMGGVPEFDQRGMPWVRVANGDDVPEARIDIGAVEWQLNPLAGDYVGSPGTELEFAL